MKTLFEASIQQIALVEYVRVMYCRVTIKR